MMPNLPLPLAGEVRGEGLVRSAGGEDDKVCGTYPQLREFSA